MPEMIGIRAEDNHKTEKRSPLAPAQCRQLIVEGNVGVRVAPSPNRIFTEQQFAESGCTIDADLSECNIVFGVKEMPLSFLKQGQAYCFFSHTTKGQAQNMPMLRRIMDLGGTLIDYEKIVDGSRRRLVFFGAFAGYAGMIDTLWIYGQRLLHEGIETPFARIRQACDYSGLEAAKKAVKSVGEEIMARGLDRRIAPFVCGVTGGGHVAQGALEIMSLLQAKNIKAQDLSNLSEEHPVRTVQFRSRDRVKLKKSGAAFSEEHFHQNRTEYVSRFNEYLPFLSVLINGIYWEKGYPEIVSLENLRSMYTKFQNPKLKVIGDITSDIGGSIACNVKSTTSLNPAYVYDPLSDTITEGWQGRGPVVLAVDKLPSELPMDASAYFGAQLLPFIPQMAHADFRRPFENLALSDEIKNAVIVHKGELCKNYRYLQKTIDKNRSGND